MLALAVRVWPQPRAFALFNSINTATNVTRTINITPFLRQLHRSTCISWHLQLRTGGFYWSKSFTARMPLLMATSA